jgi:hypothetical protein
MNVNKAFMKQYIDASEVKSNVSVFKGLVVCLRAEERDLEHLL